MDLEELKRENAEAEAALSEAAPQAEEEITEELEAEEVTEEPTEHAESEEEAEPEQAETESEAWQQSEEQDSQDSETMPVAAHVKMRRSLKAANKEKDGEIESLRAEVEALKTQPMRAQAPTGRPKREDFYDADDPDLAYEDAVFDWRNKAEQQATQQREMQRRQQEELDSIQRGANDHYQRAEKLVAKGAIDAQAFSDADFSVKKAVDEVFPNQGDFITEKLITYIGEDSEKVMYYLGRNQGKLGELKGLLREDPSGVKAAMMIGSLKATLANPVKKKTKAPKPAPDIKGTENTVDKFKKAKKQYEQAGGDIQKRLDIKLKAKAEGADTSNW